MNKIPNLCLIVNFAIKTPSQLILFSHTNNICRESIEFYSPLLWERFVKSSGNSPPEKKISLLHVAASHGLEWIVHRMCQTAKEVDDYNLHRQEKNTNNSSINFSTTSILKNLLSAKESKYSSPTLGYTALMVACFYGQSIEVVHTLLHFGSNVLVTDLLGKSAIELACEGGHAEILDLLLQQNGVSPNGRSNYITSTQIVPLRFCILYNQVKCAEVLIKKHNCDLTDVDNIGRSVLYQAARQGCVEITKMIVEKCPKKMLFLRDPEKRLPIDAARDQSHSEVVKILQEAMVVVV